MIESVIRRGPAVTPDNYLSSVIRQIKSADNNHSNSRDLDYISYKSPDYGWVLIEDNPQMTLNGLVTNPEVSKYGGFRINIDKGHNVYSLPVPVGNQRAERPNIPTEPLMKLVVRFSRSLDDVGVDLNKIRLAIKKSSAATRNLTKCKLDDFNSNILIMYDPHKYDPNSKDGELDA